MWCKGGFVVGIRCLLDKAEMRETSFDWFILQIKVSYIGRAVKMCSWQRGPLGSLEATDLFVKIL
jgi:hypothetical protein